MDLTEREIAQIVMVLEGFPTIKKEVFQGRVAETVEYALSNCAGALPPRLVLYAWICPIGLTVLHHLERLLHPEYCAHPWQLAESRRQVASQGLRCVSRAV